MLSRARKRRFAARSVTCVAGVALAAAPAAMAADIPVTPSPAPLPPLPSSGVTPIGGFAPSAPTAAPRRGVHAHSSAAAMRRSLLHLINRQRAQSGRAPFAADRRLARAAGRHAADMARRNYFGHFSPGGSSPLRRARAAGWRGRVEEAIAWGCGALSGPRSTLRAWMASAPHRAIVLGGAHAVGIGMRRGPGCGGGRVYWVLDAG
jgi:uncharacterized protein YkwD